MALSIPNSIANGDALDATKVQENFDEIETWSASTILTDGSVAFTGVPSGPSTDPSSANHLARKSYVDARADPRCGGHWYFSGNNGTTVGLNTITFNNEAVDTDGFLTPSSSTCTIPAGKGGVYALTLTWVGPDAVSIQQLFIKVNGAVRAASPFTVSDGTNRYASISWTGELAVGDQITTQYSYATGGAATSAADLWVFRVSL